MTLPEVIDVHVHFTRTRAQERTVFPKPGWPDEWFGANPEGLDAWMAAESLSHLVAVNYIDINRIIDNRLARLALPEAERAVRERELRAEMTERVRLFNGWICGYCRTEPRVTPFANVDIGVFYGDERAMMEELEARLAQGTAGVKIHPGLSRFYPADERMFALYDRLQSADVPVLSDSGPMHHAGHPVYGEPSNFAPVFERFPRLRFVMAHLPTGYWDERIDLARRFPQLHFDISGGFYAPNTQTRDGHRNVPVEDAVRFLRAIGVERVMFGSDAPGGDVHAQLRAFMGLALTDAEKERILAKNARAFLGLRER